MKKVMYKVYTVLKNVICTVLFFAILLSVLNFFTPLFRYEEDYLSTGVIDSYYAEDEGSVDVVFVGSSAVYRFIAPTMMYNNHKITSMNYSTAGMPTECINGVVDEIIDTQNPKLVVIELRPYIRWADKVMNGGKPYSDLKDAKTSYISRIVNNMPPSINRATVVHDTVSTLLEEDELEWQFEYFNTHNNWKNLKYEDYEKYVNKQLWKMAGNKEVRNIDGKYYGAEYKGTIMRSSVDYNEPQDLSDFDTIKEIDGEWLALLDKLINKAKTSETEIMFITTPYPENKTRAAYENFVAKHMEENGVTFLNCNRLTKEIGIDFTSDFYDSTHTNVKGAEKVTNYVAEFIKKEYGLKESEITEEQAKSWQEVTDLWYKEVYEPGIAKINDTVARHKAIGSTNY